VVSLGPAEPCEQKLFISPVCTLMNISSRELLKAIFTLKGSLTPGHVPRRIIYDDVELAPFKNDAKAAVSISADFEHNWAFRAWPEEVRNQKGENERRNIPFILTLLEKYGIPITWAIVGHLFLESCERGACGDAHPDMPRPRVNGRFQGDWYMHDPCTNFRQDPLWYSPDLIQDIIDSKVAHEIGTHTFSHFDFRLKYSSHDLVQREIEECTKVMEPFGVRPKSLVFPHNETEYSYSKLLFDSDIVGIRHRDAKIRLSYPERLESGIYRIFESMNLRTTSRYDYVDKVKIFVEEAAKRRTAYHIFFHPSDPPVLFRDQFRRILEYFCEERERRRIWVATMAELAAYCEARECAEIQVVKQLRQIDVMMDSSLDTAKYGEPELTMLIPSELAPRKIFFEKDGTLREVHLASLDFDRQKHRLLVNVPASSKMLRLAF